MPYQAPEIVDRVALGDDKYTVTELADGRKQLTPSPDSVSEPGTEINKALLDPLFQAVERMDNTLVPYDLYWWRRRPMSASYYEVQSDGYSAGSYSKATFDYVYHYISIFTNEHSTATLQYSKTVTINQSNGAVSLTSPTTVTVTKSSYSDSELQSLLAGKYVKGLYPSTDKIFYIPSASYVVTRNWESASDGSTSYYIGYEDSNDPGRSSLTKVMYVSSAKSESIGNWTYVSSDDSDTYPHSGTLNGTEYEYLGTVKDSALNAMNQPGIIIKSFTYANFSNNLYTVSIPYDRFAFCIMPSSDSKQATYVFGIADKNTLKMFAISSAWNSGSYSYDWFSKTDIVLRQYASSVSFGSGLGTSVGVKVVSAGLQISSSVLYSSGTLGYMKI